MRDRFADFLEYGVPVAFPPLWLPASRGVATCRLANLTTADSTDDRTVVWPSPEGRSRGRGLAPLYAHAATLPTRNPELYDLLGIVDVVRTGDVRERRIAITELRRRLAGGAAAAPRSEMIPRVDQVPVPTALEVIVAVATALRPILNRVIFAGRAAAELLVQPASPRRRLAEDATVTLLTSVSLDRLAADLRALGLERVARREGADHWRLSDGVTIEIAHVEIGDERDAPWQEYALLLTQDTEIQPGFTIRLTGGAATAALLLHRHAEADRTPSASLAAEDLMVLVAGRDRLLEEVRSAPPELRAFVAERAAALLRSGSATLLIQRLDPDAASDPAIAAAAGRRLHELASIG